LGIATPQSQEKWLEDNVERGARREPEGVEFTIYDRFRAPTTAPARDRTGD